MKWLSRFESKGAVESLQFKELSIQWQKRRGSRTLRLRLRPLQPILITSGLSVREREVRKFLTEQESWLRTQLAKFSEMEKKYPEKKLKISEKFLFLGEEMTLRVLPTPLKSVFFSRHEQMLRLHLPEVLWREMQDQDCSEFFPKLQKFYKKEAETFLTERTHMWAGEMKLYPRRLQFRNQKTRWGSCNSKGDLSLNWKLIACPLFVIDAILVHELAHLQEMNHSRRFWDLVEKFQPDHKLADHWLKENHYHLRFLDGGSDGRKER